MGRRTRIPTFGIQIYTIEVEPRKEMLTITRNLKYRVTGLARRVMPTDEIDGEPEEPVPFTHLSAEDTGAGAIRSACRSLNAVDLIVCGDVNVERTPDYDVLWRSLHPAQ